jgi:hypothetical protein
MAFQFAVRNAKKKKDKGVNKVMKNKKKELNREFMTELTKLEITEFIGVARLLNVKILKEDNETARNFVDVFSDVVDSYDKLGRNARRNLMKIVKNATKKGDN